MPFGRIRRTVPFLFILPLPGHAQTAPVRLADAIGWTLANNPRIQLQAQQEKSAHGALLQASGQFDTTATLSAAYDSDHTPLSQQAQQTYQAQGVSVTQAQQTYQAQGVSVTQTQTDTSSYSVALRTPLRSGVVLNTQLSATRTEGSAHALNKLPAQHRGSVSFSVVVPVQQSRRDSAALAETAATLTWEASKLDAHFAVAQGIYSTVDAYWKWVAAEKYAAIAREAQASTQRIADETRKLIDAGEVPAAEQLLVQASLLDKTTARMAAEQSAVDALHTLQQSVGLPASSTEPWAPADDFPELPANATVAESARRQLRELALRRRADLQAARLRREAAQASERAARSALQPVIDWSLRAGYATLVEGSSSAHLAQALAHNRSSANLGTTLSYQWPVDNRLARGRYLQQAAAYEQALIEVQTLERSIAQGVEAAFSALAQGAQQLRQSQESVALYRVSVDNEKTKHQLGNSTLLDVLALNDRYLAARQNHVAYRLHYLRTLAQLHHATGAVLNAGASGAWVQWDGWTEMPATE